MPDMSAEHIQGLEDDFMQLIEERRQMGEEQYGQFAFLNNNTFEMAFEELADMCNYALFTYIKLRLFMEGVNDVLSSDRARIDVTGDPG